MKNSNPFEMISSIYLIAVLVIILPIMSAIRIFKFIQE